MIAGGYESLAAYVHPDCGGHHNGDPQEVYLRWVQMCSMGNILRIHSDPYNDRRPWTYGNTTVDIFRKFINMRLALVPTLVSASIENSITGTPIMRRLDYEFPTDLEAVRMDQFLLAGPDTLVAPIGIFS